MKNLAFVLLALAWFAVVSYVFLVVDAPWLRMATAIGCECLAAFAWIWDAVNH